MPPAPSRTTGLSTDEAHRRLAESGPNELPRRKRPALWRKLGAQLFHFFALMLWTAAALATLAGMPQLGIAIVGVVLINGIFAYVQEERAEHAAEHLEQLLPRSATVRRDGRRLEVDARELVVGDEVLLEGGDRISADLRLAEAHHLSIDASLLTGESVPVDVEAGARLFAGTFVATGAGAGKVVATGGATRLAHVAELTRGKRRPLTPLTRELHRLVRTIALVAIVVGLAFFAAGVLVGLPARSGFLFGTGVMVALVPNGLLPTITFSLALGARAMAGRNALVRRLDAVETLGSTTFICTDKTGTLTENRMNVVAAWTPAGTATIRGQGYAPAADVTGSAAGRPELHALGLAAARASSARVELKDGQWIASGDPMEAALWAFARRLSIDVDDDAARRPETYRYPFDRTRRRMSVAVGTQLVVKGAPEAILTRCRPSAEAAATTEEWAERGLRVLAVATRPLSDVPAGAAADLAESSLELLGLLGLEDPPRSTARSAIAACREAGLRIAMVTGDHPGTARAIAKEVGLAEGPLIEGKDLPNDEAMLGALIDRDRIVLARVSPEDKLRIASALQRRGHVVAMTGDGVNDGPALQQADIGVAMGRSGTDVAREAADLVLLDDDFATIVAAIEHGRTTFANIRRFLTYHLTVNVAELAPFVMWALSGGRFPLALGVLQIMSFDLITDQLPALALGIEAPGPDVLRDRPWGRHIVDRSLLVRSLLVLGLTEAFIELVAFGAGLVQQGWRLGTPASALPGLAALRAPSGAAYAAVIVAQVANAFACRSEVRPAWSSGQPRNRLLLLGVATELLLLVLSLVIVPLARLLGQAVPSWQGALIACMAAPLVLVVDATHKSLTAARGPSAPAPETAALEPRSPMTQTLHSRGR